MFRAQGLCRDTAPGGIFANAGGAEPDAHNRGHDQLGTIKLQYHYGTQEEAPKIGCGCRGRNPQPGNSRRQPHHCMDATSRCRLLSPQPFPAGNDRPRC